MPVFIIERNFAEKMAVTPEGRTAENQINDEESIRWLISFLSVDKKKTFCLFEATSAESIREAARLAGIPADEIIEIGEEIVPSGAVNPLLAARYEQPSLIEQRGELRTSDPAYEGRATTNLEYILESIFLPEIFEVPGEWEEAMTTTFLLRMSDQELANIGAWISSLETE